MKFGNVAPPKSPEEPRVLTHLLQMIKGYVSSDSSSKTSSNSVMACKPMTKAQLEAEVWRPSYKKSRSPSVENDFA